MRRSRLLCLTILVLLPSLASCFISFANKKLSPLATESSAVHRTRTTTFLYRDRGCGRRRRHKSNNYSPLVARTAAALGQSARNDEGTTDGDWKKDVVTKEMFLRDILEPMESDGAFFDGTDDDVSVRKKKQGKKRYKVLDNRDILPFRVTLDTPDPYTHPEVKKKNAARTRKHGNAVEEHLIKSTLYRSNNNTNNTNRHKSVGSGGNKEVPPVVATEEFSTLLGEYQLGKDTTTGDILLVGNSEYKVIRHRCQYKYAGAQRFVMVRKILEVKEVGRLLSEAALKRQWNNQQSEASSAITTEQPLGDSDS